MRPNNKTDLVDLSGNKIYPVTISDVTVLESGVPSQTLLDVEYRAYNSKRFKKVSKEEYAAIEIKDPNIIYLVHDRKFEGFKWFEKCYFAGGVKKSPVSNIFKLNEKDYILTYDRIYSIDETVFQPETILSGYIGGYDVDSANVAVIGNIAYMFIKYTDKVLNDRRRLKVFKFDGTDIEEVTTHDNYPYQAGVRGTIYIYRDYIIIKPLSEGETYIMDINDDTIVPLDSSKIRIIGASIVGEGNLLYYIGGTHAINNSESSMIKTYNLESGEVKLICESSALPKASTYAISITDTEILTIGKNSMGKIYSAIFNKNTLKTRIMDIGPNLDNTTIDDISMSAVNGTLDAYGFKSNSIDVIMKYTDSMTTSQVKWEKINDSFTQNGYVTWDYFAETLYYTTSMYISNISPEDGSIIWTHECNIGYDSTTIPSKTDDGESCVIVMSGSDDLNRLIGKSYTITADGVTTNTITKPLKNMGCGIDQGNLVRQGNRLIMGGFEDANMTKLYSGQSPSPSNSTDISIYPPNVPMYPYGVYSGAKSPAVLVLKSVLEFPVLFISGGTVAEGKKPCVMFCDAYRESEHIAWDNMTPTFDTDIFTHEYGAILSKGAVAKLIDDLDYAECFYAFKDGGMIVFNSKTGSYKRANVLCDRKLVSNRISITTCGRFLYMTDGEYGTIYKTPIANLI